MPTPESLQHVFHAYDIRGLAPEELDEVFARRLGQGIVSQFRPANVLVGRDMRITSPALEAALIEGLTASGASVTRIGLCSTPMFNVLVGLGNGSYDMGVMVTASHNPGKYNGFKIVRGDASPVGQGSGMEELADAVCAAGEVASGGKQGLVTEDATGLERYIDHILKLAALPTEMPKTKIAIDAGNGMAGTVLPELLKRLPWLEVLPLYFEPDGTFPNHEANPIKTETLTDLVALVKKERCAMGVAFDGDADRIGFVDEEGTPIPGDLATAMLGQEMLRQSPNGLVLFDVRSSRAVSEALAEAGGRPKMCKVGHAFIKRQMREDGAIFAGEVSMHYYFHDLHFVESGDLVLLLVLRRLARERARMSALWKPLKKYAHSGEINFTVADASVVMRRISDAYAPLATSTSDIDGLRYEFRDPARPQADWWLSLRMSNTEPLVRLNVESRDAETTKKRVEEITKLITA
ncbi:phosphomannomutase/phosphoglucomutase [Patescibacteria group bacterium]|nr:phosphomannomutase/phosphoglucomutase [Patescibacteria group bacterium]